MRFILISLYLLTTAISWAQTLPSPPTADAIAKWIGFSKPVTLTVSTTTTSTESKDNAFSQGKLIWSANYEPPTKVDGFGVALYEKGSYLGARRAEIEDMLAKHTKEMKSLDPKVYPSLFQIQTRPDGRKVFFSVMVFGPGGGAVAMWTSFPKCDLVVSQWASGDSGDDPKTRDAPKPSDKAIESIFTKMEALILSAK